MSILDQMMRPRYHASPWFSFDEAAEPAFKSSGQFPDLVVPDPDAEVKPEPEPKGTVTVEALKAFRQRRVEQVAEAKARADKLRKKAAKADLRADAAQAEADLIEADIAKLSA